MDRYTPPQVIPFFPAGSTSMSNDKANEAAAMAVHMAQRLSIEAQAHKIIIRALIKTHPDRAMLQQAIDAAKEVHLSIAHAKPIEDEDMAKVYRIVDNIMADF